jgi:LysM repeat protein
LTVRGTTTRALPNILAGFSNRAEIHRFASANLPESATQKLAPGMIVRWRSAPSKFCAPGWLPVLPALLAVFLLAGCDRSPFNHTERAMDQAEQKQASQDFRGAVACYERALDGSAESAEAHFRLGILYDEKLNDPVSAVHHFRRYLDVAPNGAHASEAKANLSRLELTLATSLSGGTLISHAEALRLRAENADLRKQLAARPAAPLDFSATGPTAGKAGAEAGKAAARQAQQKLPPGTRTYTVQPGDTFASISRKFYKTKARAGDIQDANLNTVPNPKKLRTGQTLIIP